MCPMGSLGEQRTNWGSYVHSALAQLTSITLHYIEIIKVAYG